MPGCVVKNAEQLGRRIFSKTAAKRAYLRGVIIPNVFDIGDDLISVDRLSVASLGEVEQAAQRSSGARGPVQGWGGRRLRHRTRQRDGFVRRRWPTIRTHADIVLPLPPADADRARLRKERAQDLAKIAQWQASSVYVCPCREGGEQSP